MAKREDREKMTEEHYKRIMYSVYSDLAEKDVARNKKNLKFLEQIEQIQSSEYRNAVEECLNEAEANGELKFIDVSCLDPEQKQMEDWKYFDHIYVDQYQDGGYSGDSFAGYIFVPITKNLYLRSHYNM